jgi:hypothetical protein
MWKAVATSTCGVNVATYTFSLSMDMVTYSPNSGEKRWNVPFTRFLTVSISIGWSGWALFHTRWLNARVSALARTACT